MNHSSVVERQDQLGRRTGDRAAPPHQFLAPGFARIYFSVHWCRQMRLRRFNGSKYGSLQREAGEWYICTFARSPRVCKVISWD
jgi:hypothetical protein